MTRKTRKSSTQELDVVPRPKRPSRRAWARQEAAPALPPAAMKSSPPPHHEEQDFSAGIFDDESSPAQQVEIVESSATDTSAAEITTIESGEAPGIDDSLGTDLLTPGAADMSPATQVHGRPARSSDESAAATGDAASTSGDREAGDGAETDATRRPRRRSRRGGRGRGRAGRESTESGKQPGAAMPVSDEPEDTAESEVSPTEIVETKAASDEVWDEVEDSPTPRSGDRGAPIGEPREMLINVADADECRIAIINNGRLDELYIERTSSASNVGNIYKGRITNVEPSIQAAFVDFGLPVHGFLHVSDLHPKYFPDSKGENELVGRKTPRRHRPPIQTCLRRGQEVIVQVIKEGIGTKGPTLSTYISVPGRFLVMMPGMEQLGVSRKIEDEAQRRKVRDALAQLTLPPDMGFIVRTAGIDRNKRDLQRDLSYLLRLWEQVEERMKNDPAPAPLYKESDLVIRTIRDLYDSNLKRILVDNPTVAERVREFLAIASPKSQDVVELYEDSEPMFHRYGIESEIDKLYSKQVPLACGGSLVIEQTEALVAIDVNSGRFRVPENAEETAYRVNQEAADEIARQLRLRDLGGLIICDFIDMLAEKHRRAIERRLADALKKHKERAKLLRISKFGILELTRQRQRPSFAKSMFRDCPRCSGSGRVKATESVCLDVMRQIRIASHREGVASIDVHLSSPVATEILNRKRHELTDLERAAGQTFRIHAEAGYAIDEVRLSATDRRGREISTIVPASHPRPLPPPQAQRQPAAGAEPGPAGQRPRRRRRSRGSRGGRGRRGPQ